MKIFAYGSNMNLNRLKARVPSASKVCNASISGYLFSFNKKSSDGSGKGNITHTNNAADTVWGVVFEIDVTEKGMLDEAEGLGNGYDESIIQVSTPDGGNMKAQVYYANSTAIDNTLIPYDWYKLYVVTGAIENALPAEYITNLQSWPAIIDPNDRRRKRHLAAMGMG